MPKIILPETPATVLADALAALRKLQTYPATSAGLPGTPGTNGVGVPVAGTTGQVLAKIDGTDYNTDWVTPGAGGGMTNPMTTADDLIVGGAAGAPARLAIGSPADVLTVVSGAPTWAAPAGGGGGMTNPMTTADDLIVGGSAGAPARLGVGAGGDVLTVVAGAPAWAAPSGGGDPDADTATWIQQANAGATASSITLAAAPGAGHTLILGLDMYNSGSASAITSTDTTWTKALTWTDSVAIYDLWVGVCGAAPGSAISITHPNAYCTATVVEIADPITPTVGVTFHSAAGAWNITGMTPGHLVAVFSGNDATNVNMALAATAPGHSVAPDVVGQFTGFPTELFVAVVRPGGVMGYTTTGNATLAVELS